MDSHNPPFITPRPLLRPWTQHSQTYDIILSMKATITLHNVALCYAPHQHQKGYVSVQNKTKNTGQRFLPCHWPQFDKLPFFQYEVNTTITTDSFLLQAIFLLHNTWMFCHLEPVFVTLEEFFIIHFWKTVEAPSFESGTCTGCTWQILCNLKTVLIIYFF